MQKGIRYKYYHRNFEQSLRSELTPSGLRLKKSPPFEPVTEDFNLKWDRVLCDAERSLVKLLLPESQEVIAKI